MVSRKVLAALALFAAFAGPAAAAESQAAFLHAHTGSYTGQGQLRGATTETIQCRMAVTPNGTQRLRYDGLCVIAGERLPLKGSLSYSDTKGRYEVAASGMGTFVGRPSGNGVAFSLGRDYRQAGRTGTFQATFLLSGGSITLQLQVSDTQNGGYTASIPLRK